MTSVHTEKGKTMSKYYKAEDVIRAIEEMQNGYNGWSTRYDKSEIIEVLLDLPTIEVSEDCISREWVKGICEYMLDEEMLGYMLGHIEDAPSVVPTTEQSSKVGKWIADRHCSECEWDKKDADYTSGWQENYCPHCGAKMKG